MTASERHRLRLVIRRADRLAARLMPDAAVQTVIDRIDQHRERLAITATRSNRARGGLRQATQRRQAVLEQHQRQREQVAAAAAAADQATRDLVADAGHLAQQVGQARTRMIQTDTAARELPHEATLAERVAAEAAGSQARQQHAVALAAAIAWDPDSPPMQRRGHSLPRAPRAAAPPGQPR